MNILVIGSGGRENAIVWKLKQSPKVNKIFVSPGNGGTALLAQNLPVFKDFAAAATAVREYKIDLTVVGPEIPLEQGMADYFQQEKLPIFGVNKSCARLESSKVFAKLFMQQHGIPTAAFEVFDDANRAASFCRAQFQKADNLYSVIKADGLAAGKGVILCDSLEEAEKAIEQIMVDRIFGDAGNQIIIEKKMQGPELSLLAFCDGKTIRTLPSARDYKRVFDGQTGPNTGGMGAISPLTISLQDQQKIEETIVQPFLKGLQQGGLDYRGVIYFGIMMTPDGPSVLEFNVRFGDPETQSVLALLQEDLAELFWDTVLQRLDDVVISEPKQAAVGIVCASGGYPGKYENGKEIFGLAQDLADPMKLSNNVWAFHAGTEYKDGKFYTAGGRVLNIVALGDNIDQARMRAYEAIKAVRFENMHYRSDIGQ